MNEDGLLSIAHTFKDYLVVAAIVGAILVIAVALGTELETALYAVPFLALAAVACQCWLRSQFSMAGAPAMPLRQVQRPSAPPNTGIDRQPLAPHGLRFGLLYVLVLALCLLADLLAIFWPCSR